MDIFCYQVSSVFLSNYIDLYKRADVQWYSRFLEDHIVNNVLDFLQAIHSGNVFVEHSILSALQNWTSARESRALWLCKSEFDIAYPSPMSTIAANVIDTTTELGIPALAFFCRWPYDYNGECKQEGERGCLNDLTCSLIRQLINLLPIHLETNADLSESRFAVIKDMIGGWGMALELLTDLLEFSPPLLFIIIDGIDHLDYTSVTENLAGLLRVIQTAFIKSKANAGPQNQIIKLLFTTAGGSLALDEFESDWLEKVTEIPNARRFNRHESLDDSLFS